MPVRLLKSLSTQKSSEKLRPLWAKAFTVKFSFKRIDISHSPPGQLPKPAEGCSVLVRVQLEKCLNLKRRRFAIYERARSDVPGPGQGGQGAAHPRFSTIACEKIRACLILLRLRELSKSLEQP